jgi:hypothetical protein
VINLKGNRNQNAHKITPRLPPVFCFMLVASLTMRFMLETTRSTTKQETMSRPEAENVRSHEASGSSRSPAPPAPVGFDRRSQNLVSRLVTPQNLSPTAGFDACLGNKTAVDRLVSIKMTKAMDAELNSSLRYARSSGLSTTSAFQGLVAAGKSLRPVSRST